MAISHRWEVLADSLVLQMEASVALEDLDIMEDLVALEDSEVSEAVLLATQTEEISQAASRNTSVLQKQ